MTQQVVLQDFVAGNVRFKAAQVIDDSQYDTPALEKAGLSIAVFSPAMQALLDSIRVQRRVNAAAETDVPGQLLANGMFPDVHAAQVIRELKDFPTPVSGVITLISGVTYLIAGMVNVGTNQIRLSAGTPVVGTTNTNDGIIYTGTAALFVNDGPAPPTLSPIFLNELTLDVASGRAFGLTVAQSSASFFRIFIPVGDWGVVGATNGVVLDKCVMANSLGSVRFFQGANILLIEDCAFASAPSTTHALIDLGSNVFTSSIRMLNMELTTVAGSFGISGLASSGNLSAAAQALATLTFFTGAGTALQNITLNDKNWFFEGNFGTANSKVIGAYGMNGNATNTPLTLNVLTKILGTTTGDIQTRFTHVPSNRMDYDGLNPTVLTFGIAVSADKPLGGSSLFEMCLCKNGGPPPGAGSIVGRPFRRTFTGDPGNMSFTAIDDSAVDTDFYEMFVVNLSDSDDLLVTDLVVNVTGSMT